MKKKKLQCVLLVSVLILIGLVYLICIQYKKAEANREQPKEENFYLTTLQEEDISEISYTYQGESCHFVRGDNGFEMVEDPSKQLDSAMLDTLTKAICSLQSPLRLDAPADLAQYGLLEPSQSISVTDGLKEIRILVGDVNAVTGNYYVMVEGEAYIYCVEGERLTAFRHTPEDYILEEET